MHFEEHDPQTGAALREHVGLLVDCAQALLDDVLAGRRRCLELPRLKLYFFDGDAAEARPEAQG